MSDTQTLNSRLRLLVAKSYRAERLYSSLRATDAGQRGVGPLSELTNDTRSREWQRCYFELRTGLNDILGQSAPAQVGQAVLALREKFLRRMEEDRLSIAQGIEALAESAQREEFAHSLKLALELVKCKARAQACKAVADEVTAVLQAVGFLDRAPDTFESLPLVEPVPRPIAKGNVVELKRRLNA
jgi:hypothetical protein